MMYKCLLALLLATLSATAASETVYRSVDAQGNVTFSDEPPLTGSGVEEVTIDAPPPPASRMRHSEQEAQAAIKQANRNQMRREAAEEQRSMELREAEQALEQARKNLEQAKVIQEGDRRGKAGGGTRLTTEYLNRVKAAEKGVEEAQSRLDSFQ
jgi:predicted ribosome quality control (RQC) complex YloA/Tae2 family protein